MPPIVWGLGAAAGLFLAGLCVATGYAILRAGTRVRVARWSVARIAALAAVAAVPWLVVWLAPINIAMTIQTVPVLIGWLALALITFGVLVLLPLVALLAGGVWLTAHRRRRADTQRNDEQGV
jgi:hypothetical protein